MYFNFIFFFLLLLLTRQFVVIFKHCEFTAVSSGGYNEDWIKSNSTPSEKFNIYEYLDKSETEKSLDLPKIQEELSKKKQPKIPPKIVTPTPESSAKIIPNQVVGASITLSNNISKIIRDLK